ncbi:transposase [Rhodopirellula sp. MGV]|uniref:transposase n=1 Tax=Rhodopirellula sp. MGV TaxID=2023130 RepID=UPI002100DA43|nr:transposase [Rhodopirellula sp. MGV]
MYHRNRRNAKERRGRRLHRLRSERVERAFAHLCDTCGVRRTRLSSTGKVRKRYMSVPMAHRLGLIVRSLIGA